MFLDTDTIFYIFKMQKPNKVIFDAKIAYFIFSQSIMHICMFDQGFLDKHLHILD